MKRPSFHLVMIGCLASLWIARLTGSSKAATQVVAWGEYGLTNVPPDLTNVVAIAAGDSKNTALRSDGTVAYWDPLEEGLRPVPPGLTNVIAIAGGEYHTVALRGDGSVEVWGDYGVDGGGGGYVRPVAPFVPFDLTNIVAVAGGESYSLALKADGTVVDWGVDNGLDRIGVPPGLSNIVAITAPLACCSQLRGALEFDGTLVAWRDATNFTSIQTGLINPVAMAAGYASLAVLQSDGKEFFFTMDGDSNDLFSDGMDSNVVAIASGWEFGILSVKADGTITTTDGQEPAPPRFSDIRAASVAFGHGLGLLVTGPPLALKAADRTVAEGEPVVLQATIAGPPPLTYNWQFNGAVIPGETNVTLRIPSAQLANTGSYTLIVGNAFGTVTAGPTALAVVPLLITHKPASRAVFRGATVAFEVAAAGLGPISYQWQFNGKDIAQATQSTLLLTNVQPAEAGTYSVTVRNPSSMLQSASALLGVGQVAAWGSYYSRGSLPVGLTNVIALAATPNASDFSSIALKSDGTIVTWGGGAGLVETGLIEDLSNVVAIASGGSDSFFLALRSDGTVVNWANNGPLAVPALSNVVAIAGGGENLALRQDGRVAAWQLDWIGTNQVIAAATNQYAPPKDLADVVALAASYYHSLALRRDGTVVAWGDNFGNQTDVPVDLTNAVGIAAGYEFSLALREDGAVVGWGAKGALPQDLTNVVRIAASYDNALALKADGTVVAWGDNFFAQTNVPPGLLNVADIAAGSDHGLALLGDGPPVQQAPIVNSQVRNGRFECSISTESGRVYQLEFKNTLSDRQWTPLPLVAGTGRLLTLHDPSATTSRERFYRIQRW